MAARLAAGCLVLALTTIAASAQGRGAAPRPSPRAGAPIDLTGYWVSLVTEDWRFRMFTAPRGDFAGVPLNPDGRKLAQAWDAAKDEAAGESCKAYGSGGVMRMPGRLHITWADEATLTLETDAGTQTRTFRFNAAAGEGGGWQGLSSASWDRSPSTLESQSPGSEGRSPGGSLKVITTSMRPGYLRRNGIPYSGAAVMTEYFDRFELPGGGSLLVVSSEIVDPQYLVQPFWTSAHFTKQNDATGWSPTPCRSVP